MLSKYTNTFQIPEASPTTQLENILKSRWLQYIQDLINSECLDPGETTALLL